MEFNNHSDTWKAFQILHEASTKDGVAFLSPSWVRSQRYYKMALKARTAAEHEENEKEIFNYLEKEKKKLIETATTSPADVTIGSSIAEDSHETDNVNVSSFSSSVST
jgi:hypothetical protein